MNAADLYQPTEDAEQYGDLDGQTVGAEVLCRGECVYAEVEDLLGLVGVNSAVADLQDPAVVSKVIASFEQILFDAGDALQLVRALAA
jgi:hypothetical protein